MKFYTHQHKHYCGIDLHAKAMYVGILDEHGTKLVHKNLPTTPEAFLRLIAPYREDLVVGVACIFTWEAQVGSEGARSLTRRAKTHDVQTFARLQSVPAIGQRSAWVLF